MLKLMLLSTVSLIVVVSAASARNPVYECEGGVVENKSRLIAYPKDEVATHNDRARKICTFSLNGATEDGPSTPKRIPPKDKLSQIQSGDLNYVILMLTSAPRANKALLDRHRRAAARVLNSASRELAACFRGLVLFGTAGAPKPRTQEGSIRFYLNVNKDGVRAMCRIFPPGRFFNHFSAVPVLELSIRPEQNIKDVLFIPKSVFDKSKR